jgi:hypothetical protein
MKEVMAMESGVTTPSALLDDDGRPKRTGLISFHFLSLYFLHAFLSCVFHNLLVSI